ncbi:MAG: hypothetical protein ABF293_11890 [Flavobacteriaceae bacterium]
MKQPRLKLFLLTVSLAVIAPMTIFGQCDIFQSEIIGVKQHAEEVQKIVGQVESFAESAAFAANYSAARAQARKAQIFAGEVLGSAYEAVNMAAEAQHYSGSCGKDDVKSYAIDAERHAIDTRDFADEAYTNAKKASGARNLGDVRYFMRKSLDAAKEAQKSADAAVYAASDALYSCDHTTVAAGGN